MFFFKKNERKTWDAYEERISNLEKRMKNAENELLGLATENEVIRNKVLRKIQFKRKEAKEIMDEEKEEETSKPLNTPMFNPFL